MRNSLFTLIFILLSGLVFESAKAQSLTEKKAEAIKSEVEAFFQEMLLNAERLDYNKLNTGVDDNHAAGFITNGKYYSRYSTLMDDLITNAQGVDRQDISIREKKITVLSDKIVLMTVIGTTKATLSDARVITVGFHWSFVYEKIKDNWKVIHSHQSREL